MLVSWIVKRSEKQTGSPAPHLKKLSRLSGPLFWRLILALSALRSRAPHVEARAVASLLAVLEQDCGPCLEIAVRMALQEGARDEVLEAVLAASPERLPAPLQAVYNLGRAVSERSAEVSRWSREVEQSLGAETLADVALALAFTPLFPRLKRALGVASEHCIRLDGLVERLRPRTRVGP